LIRLTVCIRPYKNFSGGIDFATFIWELFIQESEIKIQDRYFPMDFFSNLNKLSIEDDDLIYRVFLHYFPFGPKSKLLVGIFFADFFDFNLNFNERI